MLLPPEAGNPPWVVLRHLHPRPLGKESNGIRVVQPFYFHNEVYCAPALVAAEAVEDPLFRRNGETGRLLIVEGTQSKEVAASPGKTHILPHYIFDWILFLQLL